MPQHSPAGTGADRVSPVFRVRWWVLLIGAGLVAAAWLVDQGVTDRLTHEAVRHRIERWLALPVGLSPYLIILAILASLPNRRRLWVGFLAPVLLSTLLSHLLKWLIGRGRPRLGLGAWHFEPLAGADFCDSFPSGHTSAAGAVAVLLGIYFPRARWVFYFCAAMVGLERVVSDWHFLSDVLAGYVLGVLSVCAGVRLLGGAFYRKDLPPKDGP